MSSHDIKSRHLSAPPSHWTAGPVHLHVPASEGLRPCENQQTVVRTSSELARMDGVHATVEPTTGPTHVTQPFISMGDWATTSSVHVLSRERSDWPMRRAGSWDLHRRHRRGCRRCKKVGAPADRAAACCCRRMRKLVVVDPAFRQAGYVHTYLHTSTLPTYFSPRKVHTLQTPPALSSRSPLCGIHYPVWDRLHMYW